MLIISFAFSESWRLRLILEHFLCCDGGPNPSVLWLAFIALNQLLVLDSIEIWRCPDVSASIVVAVFRVKDCCAVTHSQGAGKGRKPVFCAVLRLLARKAYLHTKCKAWLMMWKPCNCTWVVHIGWLFGVRPASVTQLSNNAVISVWRIVWAAWNCCIKSEVCL